MCKRKCVFAGNQLQGAKRPKLGGRRIEARRGAAPLAPDIGAKHRVNLRRDTSPPQLFLKVGLQRRMELVHPGGAILRHHKAKVFGRERISLIVKDRVPKLP